MDAVPELFLRALLLGEDSNFWGHPGIDLSEMPAAIATNLERGTFARGGSTIPQQLAKNLFLSREKRLGRKLEEASLALLLDASLGKRRVLEIYLNVIEWGPGVYGLRPAARHYFGREPSELTGEADGVPRVDDPRTGEVPALDRGRCRESLPRGADGDAPAGKARLGGCPGSGRIRHRPGGAARALAGLGYSPGPAVTERPGGASWRGRRTGGRRRGARGMSWAGPGVGLLGGEDGVSDPRVLAGGDLLHEGAMVEVRGPVEAQPTG